MNCIVKYIKLIILHTITLKLTLIRGKMTLPSYLGTRICLEGPKSSNYKNEKFLFLKYLILDVK